MGSHQRQQKKIQGAGKQIEEKHEETHTRFRSQPQPIAGPPVSALRFHPYLALIFNWSEDAHVCKHSTQLIIQLATLLN